MSVANFWRSPTMKAFTILVLIVILQIPFAQVRWLVQERQARASEANTRIAQQWSGEQVLSPAQWTLWFEENVVDANDASKQRVIRYPRTVTPDAAQLTATLKPEVRRLGIFAIPVYTSAIEVNATFNAASLRAALPANPLARLVDSNLSLELSDLRGVRGIDQAQLNEQQLKWQTGSPVLRGLNALRAAAALPDLQTASDQTLRYTLHLAGSNTLKIVPLARDTKVRMQGAWPHPGFDQGAFLPLKHQIDAKGFHADWQVLEFNRAIPAFFNPTDTTTEQFIALAFGTRLVQPADHYQQNERSGKYGSLLLVLLFAMLFLFELIGRVPLHAIQYGLIGLSLATFYVLLLALSEHLGFARAYLIASIASIAVIGVYAMAILKKRSRGVWLMLALALAYGFFYVLAAADTYALLMGAVALFGLLAGIMWLTRHQDWRGNGSSLSVASAPPTPPE